MLDRLGVEHEWFRIRRRVVHRGKLILRTMPLFPGYIFLIAKFLWSQIERILGVRGFVRFGGKVETIPDQVVIDLKQRAGRSGVVDEAAMPYRAGQPVWVRVGGEPRAGIFKEFLTPAKVLVDVELLGRVVSCSARVGELKPRD